MLHSPAHFDRPDVADDDDDDDYDDDRPASLLPGAVIPPMGSSKANYDDDDVEQLEASLQTQHLLAQYRHRHPIALGLRRFINAMHLLSLTLFLALYLGSIIEVGLIGNDPDDWLRDEHADASGFTDTSGSRYMYLAFHCVAAGAEIVAAITELVTNGWMFIGADVLEDRRSTRRRARLAFFLHGPAYHHFFWSYVGLMTGTSILWILYLAVNRSVIHLLPIYAVMGTIYVAPAVLYSLRTGLAHRRDEEKRRKLVTRRRRHHRHRRRRPDYLIDRVGHRHRLS